MSDLIKDVNKKLKEAMDIALKDGGNPDIKFEDIKGDLLAKFREQHNRLVDEFNRVVAEHEIKSATSEQMERFKKL